MALSVWAACLISHAWFTAVHDDMSGNAASAADHRGVPGGPLGIPVMPVLGVCVTVLGMMAMTILVIRHRWADRGSWMVHMVVPLGAGLLAAASMMASDAMVHHDAATVAARTGNAFVGAMAYVETPPVASSLWQADCQADVTIRGITIDGVDRGSVARARLFSSGRGCDVLRRGSTVQVSGNLSRAKYGKNDLWFVCAGDRVRRIHEPDILTAHIGMMHDAFFRVTERLSDQGRVLVPGITIGLLGQDHLGPSRQEPVNDTYAKRLQDCFRRAGIMHLMAVSGGHFALVGVLIRRGSRRFHLSRYLTAMVQIGCFMLLAAAMYPSDSVRRAVIMGAMLTVAWMRGRPAQALSALAWTTVFVLFIDPQMSRSFGFALSCSAVLGIVLCGTSMARALSEHMPAALADAMAMTICAQLFTLPIQVLMQPELPVLSVAANLLVAPFVDIATLCGLVGMVIAPVNEAIAHIFVWTSSLSTAVMQWCALWLRGEGMPTIPWSGGVIGAVAMAFVELLVACGSLMMAKAWVRRCRVKGTARWNNPLWPRMRRWLRETADMFG